SGSTPACVGGRMRIMSRAGAGPSSLAGSRPRWAPAGRGGSSVTSVPGTPPLTHDRLAALLDRLRGRRVVVIGDAMLDRYLIGDIERISPEAPVPVVNVTERRQTLGGAANVAANVTALGAHAELVGIVGTDREGEALRQEVDRLGIGSRCILTLPGRPTTTKTRVVARGQQVVRIDEEEAGGLPDD